MYFRSLCLLIAVTILVHSSVCINGDETVTSADPEVRDDDGDDAIKETPAPGIPNKPDAEETDGETDVDGETEDESPSSKGNEIFTTTTTTVATTKEQKTNDVSTEKEKTPIFTTEKTSEVAKEAALPFAVRNSNDKICILAKFHANLTITYPGKEEQITVHLPQNAVSRGECGGKNKNPVLHLSWDEFNFTLTFSKRQEDEKVGRWAVISLELSYDLSEAAFTETTGNERRTAKSEDLQMFETSFGKSYYCSSPEIIDLYNDKKKVVTVSFKDVKLQPFNVKDGEFSASQKCKPLIISVTDEPFVQDETVPLAVGLTLAILTLVVVLGFSIHRAYTVRKVDYNSME